MSDAAEQLLNLSPKELDKLPADVRDKIEAVRKQVLAAQRLRTVRSAKDSLLDFVQMSMPDPEYPDDATKSRYQVHKVHKYLASVLEDVEKGKKLRVCLSVQPRVGKALAVGTPVPTPDGWSRMGDLRPGDFVFDHLGRPARVRAVSPVWRDRPLYRVLTDDAGEIITDAEHEWFGRHTRYSGDVVFTSEALSESFERTGRRAKITPQGALTLPDVDLPVDPYVLGVWLGDGCSQQATITAGGQDFDFLRHEVETCGYRTTDRSTKGTFGVLGVQPHLRKMNLLGNKHVPTAYLRASIEQRRALVQGLVDTDGYVCPRFGRTEVTFTNESLAIGFQELVRSLGVKCSRHESEARIDGRYISQRWRMGFIAQGLARLPRRAMAQRAPDKRPDRYISAEPAGRGDTVCIEVDSPDHLFLAGREMIPTHNSELVSKKLPAWLLGRDPYRQIIVTSYGDELAKDFGREVRATVLSPFYQQVFPNTQLRRGSRAMDRLQTEQGGVANFVGIGGPLTGRGADYLLIDDPIKDAEEARSKSTKDKHWEWFSRVALSRVMGKGGAVVVTATRWAEDDLIGRLTDPELGYTSEKEAAKWVVINIPAFAEENDPLDREKGEILWEERTPREFLESFRELDPAGFAALYMGKPAPPEGNFFKRDHLRGYRPHELPDNLRYYAASDHAISTEQGRDSTVLGVVGVDERDNVYVMPDVVWAQLDANDQVNAMLELMRRYPIMNWWAEKGHISKSIGPFLRKRMQETNTYCAITERTPVKDKQTRAQAVQARMAMGKVFLPTTAPWYNDAVEQMLNFPNGAHDDFVDFIAWIGIGLASQIRADSIVPEEKPEPKSGSLEWILQTSERVRTRNSATERTARYLH